MRKAFKNVKRNQGAAGMDKVSIRMFEANIEQNLDSSMRDLKTRGKFQPKPLRRVRIPKGKGNTRPLGIPVLRDRIAQEVLRQLLSPVFEPLFHEDSIRSGFDPSAAVIWRWSGYCSFGNKGARLSWMPIFKASSTISRTRSS
uniref:Reverse transcriptase (RNA-dependent DNA polymerase) n=1 Tax=Candidatus Kentrum sp. TC TaxID=2126339 RepID=A0A451A2P0_9GAMM|nr:MAG: hypothetical protein BECKTC1821F_GA0114240_104417 [Candidatus Kentron sp. TC]